MSEATSQPAAGVRVAVTHPKLEIRARWCAEIEALLPGARAFGWMPPGEAALAASGNAGAPGSGAAQAAPLHADYAIGWGPTAAFFESVRGLKAFFSTGAGVDHVLREPAYPGELPLIRLEDAGMGQQMAEYCSYEVIRLYHHRARYAAQQRAGSWLALEPPPRAEFGVGVLGLGVLGAMVARTLADFGYPVRGYAQTPKDVPGVTCFSGEQALPAFLAGCRVLILMLPLTAATAGLVNRRLLAMLPAGAHLVNVARGGLIVDEDLLAALDSGQLAGATLDVFHQEPLPAGHPFWTHPGVRITPHIAAITLVPESARQVAAKIERLERGLPVSGVVERSRGY